MTKSELVYFEEKLLDEQEKILGVVEIISESGKPVQLDQNSVGRLSRMDAMQAQAMAQAGQQRQQDQLTLIADALARIDDGDYGRCLQCDSYISTKRLEIEPTVCYCIDCASALEK